MEVSSLNWVLVGLKAAQGRLRGLTSRKETEKKSQTDVLGASGLVLFLREGKRIFQSSLETTAGLVKTYLY